MSQQHSKKKRISPQYIHNMRGLLQKFYLFHRIIQ